MSYRRKETIGNATRWTCEQCGAGFNRDKSGKRPIRFCSPPCYYAWRKENNVTAGQFKSGSVPWNKDLKGIRLSPDSEFKKGQKPASWVPVGTETIRTDKNGAKRCWVKVAEPGKWVERYRIVYEKHFGPIRPGLVIHHKDHDSLNDAPSNLEALTRSQHIEKHRADLLAAKKKAA